MSKARDALIAAVALLVGRRHRREPRPGEREPIIASPPPKSPDAELFAILLLLAAAACAVAFIVVYVLDRLPAHTQLLGWLTTTVPSYWEPPSTLPDISLDELIGLDEGRNAGE